MKDAIARNYDAVEDGGELFLIAVRRSGSFCQPGRLDAQQSLSARSVGNLILRLGSLFEPSIPISISVLVNQREGSACSHPSSIAQGQPRAANSSRVLSAEETRKFKT
jgi:hypothetical protein